MNENGKIFAWFARALNTLMVVKVIVWVAVCIVLALQVRSCSNSNYHGLDKTKTVLVHDVVKDTVHDTLLSRQAMLITSPPDTVIHYLKVFVADTMEDSLTDSVPKVCVDVELVRKATQRILTDSLALHSYSLRRDADSTELASLRTQPVDTVIRTSFRSALELAGGGFIVGAVGAAILLLTM